MTIREKMKGNKLIHLMGRWIQSVYYFYVKKWISECVCSYRKIFGSKYSYLKKYKDIHDGESCFIVCTGPSLTFDDLEKLDGLYAFGMNSIIKACKQTKWKPTYYGIQDEYVYKKMVDEYLDCPIEEIFVSHRVAKRIQDKNFKYNEFWLNMYGHDYGNFKSPKFKFSDRFDICSYDGFSITYSLMQLAVYMGFKNIYLFGCDNSYPKDPDKQYFIPSGHVSSAAQISALKQREAFAVARKYAEEHGIKIYNATRGGELEVFDRVDFDDVIAKLKNLEK